MNTETTVVLVVFGWVMLLIARDEFRFARDRRAGVGVLSHRDDIPWWDTPIPTENHTCRPQSWSKFSNRLLAETCACGAWRVNGGQWTNRNSR